MVLAGDSVDGDHGSHYHAAHLLKFISMPYNI